MKPVSMGCGCGVAGYISVDPTLPSLPLRSLARMSSVGGDDPAGVSEQSRS